MPETVVQELAGYGAAGLLLAVEVPRFVRDIGSFAGFAAIIGLAVLSALYFSQARDVRRLREWAGRAPERAAEEEERLQAAARAAAAAAGARAATSAQPGTNAAEAGAPQTAVPQTAAGARTAAGAAAAGGGEGGGVATAPPRITPRIPSQQTAVLSETLPSAKRPRWYRRINWPAPRYIALIVAGVLVVGGGAAFGVTKLLEDDTAGEQAAGGGAGGGSETDESAPINPADVKVSVLNGTTVAGLAAQIGDTVREKGFQLINVANATEQQRAESVVLYTEGANREARAVARRLDISQLEPADDTSRSLAGDATVIVIVGADQTR